MGAGRGGSLTARFGRRCWFGSVSAMLPSRCREGAVGGSALDGAGRRQTLPWTGVAAAAANMAACAPRPGPLGGMVGSGALWQRGAGSRQGRERCGCGAGAGAYDARQRHLLTTAMLRAVGGGNACNPSTPPFRLRQWGPLSHQWQQPLRRSLLREGTPIFWGLRGAPVEAAVTCLWEERHQAFS
jgi:hypothetical protein